MRIMISGGAGMIGRRLVAHLFDSGHEIWILTRSDLERHNIPGAKMIRWDGSSLGQWFEIMNQMDAIINLAGENIGSKLWTAKRKKLIIESRVNPGKILVEAIKKSNKHPKVFIQASAIGFYEKNQTEILNEDSPISNDFFGDVCRNWEGSSIGLEAMGIRRIVIRTGVVLAKEEGILKRIMLPFKLFIGGPIGNGKQILSWIHFTDVVSAIQFLLENENASGVFNLTTPKPSTNASMGKKLAKIMNRPYWIPVPALFLRLFLGEMSSLVLDGQYIFPKRLLAEGFSFKFEEMEQALIDLVD